MLIKEYITITSVDNKWVIQNLEDRNFLVNENAKKLFEILRRNWDIKSALLEFNTIFQSDFDENQFDNLVNKSFGGYNILNDDQSGEKQSLKNGYLKLKIQLINPKIAGILSRPFQILYHPGLFWPLFVFLICMNLLFYRVLNVNIKEVNYSFVPAMFYLTLLFHELGHIGACAKKSLKHGGIGFGFYFIFPVMYADITNIWLADKKSRIIANLAGVFNEMLYAFVLLGLAWVIKDSTLALVGFMIMFMSLIELNPFGRMDGYWILSDLSNTPNLLAKSKKIITSSYQDTVKQIPLNWSFNELWLGLYGVINFCLIIFFIGFILFSQWSNLLKFPETIYRIINNIISGDFSLKLINKNFLLILTFYILIIKLLIKIANKDIPIWLRKMHQLEGFKSIFKNSNN